MENITIKINGIEVSAPKGSTILEQPVWLTLKFLLSAFKGYQ